MVNPAQHYGLHFIDQNDIDAVTNVLRGEFLTGGKAIPNFELAIKEVCKASFALCCGNGTIALHMACAALGLGPGKTAIVPSITFVATANAAVMCGADVVFSDVNPDTGLMEPHHLKEALSRCKSKPAVVMPVHMGGQVCDMPALSKIARTHDLKIIEDASHAFGTTFFAQGNTYQVGQNVFSDLTTFSFHAVKNITTGEGGAVTAKDQDLYDRLRRLRSHGLFREPEYFKQSEMGFTEDQANIWYYEMPEYGYNYRMTDIQAALGSSQIAKLPHFREKRARLRRTYEELLKPYAPHVIMVPQVPDCHPLWHLATTLIDFTHFGRNRNVVMRSLAERGIGTQVHYIPVHLQPFYRQYSPSAKLIGAERYYARTLSLPLHIHMEETYVHQTVEELCGALGL
jgi:UDP-4-amino-4,6-dideoxy-N-acetyl-beta-L-altrosamine transaminase